MSVPTRIGAISRALDGAELVWFGIRGTDAATLLRIPEFTASFSITDPLLAAKLEVSVCLETITGRRVDLDAYDIDLDHSDHVREFRSALLQHTNGVAAVASYRPSHVVSAAVFAGGSDCRRVGLFKERQSAFEYKPWVETELVAWGVQVIPWRYIADEYKSTVLGMLEEGPVVLRSTRGSGGDGISLLESKDDLEVVWPFRSDGIVPAAHYVHPSVPVNVGACVYADGSVRLHPGSVQLIGIPACTTRRFGYCGNDFVAFRDIDDEIVARLDEQTRRAGAWLASCGYVGAFGTDFLVAEDGVYLAEINPRLQGSSAVSASMTSVAELPDIVTEHVAAGLGIDASDDLSLLDWRHAIDAVAQVIVHHSGVSAPDDPSIDQLGPPIRAELVAEPEIAMDDGAVVSRLIFDHAVTSTGFELVVRAEGVR